MSELFNAFNKQQEASAKRRQLEEQNKRIKQQNEDTLYKQGFVRGADGKLSTRENSDQDVKEQQNALILSQLGAVKKQLAVNESDSRLSDYLETGDANALQQALDNSPELKQLYAGQGVNLVGNVDFDNDAELLRRNGIDINKLDVPKRKEYLKRALFKYHDGKQWQVGDTDMLIARTGMARRASAAQLKTIHNFDAHRKRASGGETTEDIATANKAAEAKIVNDTTKVQTDRTKVEGAVKNNARKTEVDAAKAAADQTKANADILEAETEAKFEEQRVANETKNAETNRINANKKGSKTNKGSASFGSDGIGKKTAATRQTERAAGRFDGLLTKHFDGDKASFYATDLDAPGNEELKGEVQDTVNEMMSIQKLKLTGADKKRIDEFTKLSSLAKPAAQLSESDVGFVDSFLQKTASYFTSNPEFLGNTSAKSSYEAFKGILRVAMIGAAQTTSEMKNFRQMLGDQTQQGRTLLTQLDTTLARIEAQHDAAAKTYGHRAIAKVMLGSSVKRLAQSRREIAKSLSKGGDSPKPARRSRAASFFGKTKPNSKRTRTNAQSGTTKTPASSVDKRQAGESIADYLARTRG